VFYYLFNYLHDHFNLAGSGLFKYITFRASMAAILSLVISLLLGKRIVKYLQNKQIGETIRDLGLAGEQQKKGTPTMGGLIILSAIVIPTLFFARVLNVYIILLLATTIWMGLIGFLDDYIKVFKKDKRGLAGKFKVMGQVGLGLIVGTTLYFNQNVMIKKEVVKDGVEQASAIAKLNVLQAFNKDVEISMESIHKPVTTIPFVKTHEFNYAKLLNWLGEGYENYAWIIYILIVVFIITAVSNGANITDGIDGLATGTSALIGVTLVVFAYVSGNLNFARYLNIMYIPSVGELVVFGAAFVGACVGFLWYNTYPAQVFMGDTGSLALGGIIGTMALCVRKELMIPIFCGIFLVENLSVMLQVGVFKYRKRKYGLEYAQQNRLFKMSPLHHHYQKNGMHESKIVMRFFIIGIMLMLFTIATLKIR
jgi:phospho-N-acetylmuramoyl-pentapeptide-transferase